MHPNTNDRRVMATYWTLSIAVILFAILGGIQLAIREKHVLFSDAERNARNLVNALEAHAQQIAIKLDMLSDAVAEDVRRVADNEQLPLKEVLRRRASAEPAALAIAIVTKDGDIVASSSSDPNIYGKAELRRVVEKFSSPASPAVFVSEPYVFPTEHNSWSGWTLDFNKRLTDEENHFSEFVSIVLNGEFLYEFYDRIGDHQTSAVGLVGEDGIIRASNREAAIGHSTKNLIDVEIRDIGGSQISTSTLDGKEYLFVYAKAPASPFYAYVGVPTAPLLREWRLSLLPIAVTLSSLIVALTLTGWMLYKYVISRRAQLVLARDAASERRDREFLQAVLNTGGALVAVTSAEGELVVANSSFYRVFEVEDIPDELVALEYIFSKSISQLNKSVPLQTSLTTEDKNGQRREITWTLNPIKNQEDQIEHFVAIGFDITTQRRAELAVYQAGKMISIGEMATGLAHEINQPLATIGMNVDVLKDRIAARKATPKFIDERLLQISKQIQRTASIVDRMRIFGRQSKLVLEVFTPDEAISDVLAIIESLIRDSGINITVARETNCSIKADKILVEQIVMNLLTNARDAILSNRETNGASAGKILVVIRDYDQKMVAIDVSDTGVGFTPKEASQLFDPFFTTKPVGKGTGLGLPLSFGMASDMGGFIEAVSLQAGARFTLVLPAAKKGV